MRLFCGISFKNCVIYIDGLTGQRFAEVKCIALWLYIYVAAVFSLKSINTNFRKGYLRLSVVVSHI